MFVRFAKPLCTVMMVFDGVWYRIACEKTSLVRTNSVYLFCESSCRCDVNNNNIVFFLCFPSDDQFAAWTLSLITHKYSPKYRFGRWTFYYKQQDSFCSCAIDRDNYYSTNNTVCTEGFFLFWPLVLSIRTATYCATYTVRTEDSFRLFWPRSPFSLLALVLLPLLADILVVDNIVVIDNILVTINNILVMINSILVMISCLLYTSPSPRD